MPTYTGRPPSAKEQSAKRGEIHPIVVANYSESGGKEDSAMISPPAVHTHVRPALPSVVRSGNTRNSPSSVSPLVKRGLRHESHSSRITGSRTNTLPNQHQEMSRSSEPSKSSLRYNQHKHEVNPPDIARHERSHFIPHGLSAERDEFHSIRKHRNHHQHDISPRDCMGVVRNTHDNNIYSDERHNTFRSRSQTHSSLPPPPQSCGMERGSKEEKLLSRALKDELYLEGLRNYNAEQMKHIHSVVKRNVILPERDNPRHIHARSNAPSRRHRPITIGSEISRSDFYLPRGSSMLAREGEIDKLSDMTGGTNHLSSTSTSNNGKGPFMDQSHLRTQHPNTLMHTHTKPYSPSPSPSRVKQSNADLHVFGINSRICGNKHVHRDGTNMCATSQAASTTSRQSRSSRQEPSESTDASPKADVRRSNIRKNENPKLRGAMPPSKLPIDCDLTSDASISDEKECFQINKAAKEPAVSAKLSQNSPKNSFTGRQYDNEDSTKDSKQVPSVPFAVRTYSQVPSPTLHVETQRDTPNNADTHVKKVVQSFIHSYTQTQKHASGHMNVDSESNSQRESPSNSPPPVKSLSSPSIHTPGSSITRRPYTQDLCSKPRPAISASANAFPADSPSVAKSSTDTDTRTEQEADVQQTPREQQTNRDPSVLRTATPAEEKEGHTSHRERDVQVNTHTDTPIDDKPQSQTKNMSLSAGPTIVLQHQPTLYHSGTANSNQTEYFSNHTDLESDIMMTSIKCKDKPVNAASTEFNKLQSSFTSSRCMEETGSRDLDRECKHDLASVSDTPNFPDMPVEPNESVNSKRSAHLRTRPRHDFNGNDKEDLHYDINYTKPMKKQKTTNEWSSLEELDRGSPVRSAHQWQNASTSSTSNTSPYTHTFTQPQVDVPASRTSSFSGMDTRPDDVHQPADAVLTQKKMLKLTRNDIADMKVAQIKTALRYLKVSCEFVIQRRELEARLFTAVHRFQHDAHVYTHSDNQTHIYQGQSVSIPGDVPAATKAQPAPQSNIQHNAQQHPQYGVQQPAQQHAPQYARHTAQVHMQPTAEQPTQKYAANNEFYKQSNTQQNIHQTVQQPHTQQKAQQIPHATQHSQQYTQQNEQQIPHAQQHSQQHTQKNAHQIPHAQQHSQQHTPLHFAQRYSQPISQRTPHSNTANNLYHSWTQQAQFSDPQTYNTHPHKGMNANYNASNPQLQTHRIFSSHINAGQHPLHDMRGVCIRCWQRGVAVKLRELCQTCNDIYLKKRAQHIMRLKNNISDPVAVGDWREWRVWGSFNAVDCIFANDIIDIVDWSERPLSWKKEYNRRVEKMNAERSRVEAEKRKAAAEKERKQSAKQLAQERLMQTMRIMSLTKNQVQQQERLWAAFERTAERVTKFDDIPWPNENPCSIISELNSEESEQEIKKKIRMAQLRWHPDKFMNRFGKSLHPDEREKVLSKLNYVMHKISQEKEKLANPRMKNLLWRKRSS
eukprot:CFRG7977T1